MRHARRQGRARVFEGGWAVAAGTLLVMIVIFWVPSLLGLRGYR